MKMEEKFGEEQERILGFLDKALYRDLTNDDIAIAGWLARSDFFARDTIMDWLEALCCPPVPVERERSGVVDDIVTVFPRSNRVTVGQLKEALGKLDDSAFISFDDVDNKKTHAITGVEKTKSGKWVWLVGGAGV